MKYAMLIYENEERWQKLDEQGKKEVLAAYEAFHGIAGKRILGGEALVATSQGKTLRREAEKTLATDGPFAETKEQLAGFYLLECEDLDDAIEMATHIPAAKTGSIEVRPIRELSS